MLEVNDAAHGQFDELDSCPSSPVVSQMNLLLTRLAGKRTEGVDAT